MKHTVEYSPWFRPLRMLFEEGKPPGEITSLWVGAEPAAAVPFGLLSGRERLCFWPIVPPEAKMVEGCLPHLIDHVTLEFPSMRSHATYFDETGSRAHHSGGWRLHAFPGTGLALWFSLITRWSVLDKQDRRPGMNVRVPDSDARRRESEFVKFAQSFKQVFVKVPPRNPAGDFLYCVCYLVIDPPASPTLTKEMVLFDRHTDDLVDGWPNGTVSDVQLYDFKVGKSHLALASSCPPGRMRVDLSMGLPHRKGAYRMGESK